MRDFWIRFGSATNDGPFPKPVVYTEDPKLANGFGGITIHVREVGDDMMEDAEFLIKSFLHSQYIIKRAEEWLKKFEER